MPSVCAGAHLFNPDPALYLPHRYPFLLLDRVLELEPGVRAVAVTTVSICREIPQILLVESVAQLAGIATIQQDGEGGFLAAIDRAEFHGSPVPGDVLTISVRVIKSFGRLFMVQGEVSCGNSTMLTVQLMLGAGRL
jgi:3-hydroxyacyl-[acyl-carrier-protein] dehydratase